MADAVSRIQERLHSVEQHQGVRILLAVESGSRAWGFASLDSDYDVRLIYVRPVRDIVRIDPPRDVIELPLDGDLDINGWDLAKALTLFRKSNPPLLEWLHSPIVYRERGPLAATLRELSQSQTSLRRMAYHYLSMAKRNYLDYIDGRSEVALKKYLYVLRPLACIRWLHAYGSPSPTPFLDVLAGIELPHDVRTRLTELIAQKRAIGEMGTQPHDQLLDWFIAQEIEKAPNRIDGLTDHVMDTALLNSLLWEIVGV